jgi:hypothetical protein
VHDYDRFLPYLQTLYLAENDEFAGTSMAKKKDSSIASTPEVLRPHGEDDLVGRKYSVLAD